MSREKKEREREKTFSALEKDGAKKRLHVVWERDAGFGNRAVRVFERGRGVRDVVPGRRGTADDEREGETNKFEREMRSFGARGR